MATLASTDRFADRHNGPSDSDIRAMLEEIGMSSIGQLIDATVPESIRIRQPLDLPAGITERALLDRARELGDLNQVWRSYIGMGYSGTVTPPAIQRHILENPSWYTQYTPYQAEISQGRLEALLNFQTVITELTGMEIANSSLLDEATAAAEAMMMLRRVNRKQKGNRFFVSDLCHPQVISVVETRAVPLGIEVVTGDHDSVELTDGFFGALVQYPATDGQVINYEDFCSKAHEAGALVAVAADLLALTLLSPPGEWGADAVVGNSQRFGVPLGYGGPHAAFFATREAYKRQVPGRIIGVTIDADEQTALRMALQTREQHIRRDKATSNICTAQVLLAVMAGAYAVYHGPEGLRAIANRIHKMAQILGRASASLGHTVRHEAFFDTVRVELAPGSRDSVMAAASAKQINVRHYDDGTIGIALDETVTAGDLLDLLSVLGGAQQEHESDALLEDLASTIPGEYDGLLTRESSYLDHPAFNSYHSETELMRYLHRLASKDLSLTTSMIPLGSCTMKLNAASELMPVSFPEFGSIHPFAPDDQTAGYQVMINELSDWLAEITGFETVSMQPNSGASGEYAGLLAIRAYHRHQAGDEPESQRTVCLIPDSAHGTNPASAVMAGMKVVVVKCDDDGNIDLVDLEQKARENADHLAAAMVTYPSTHGVFESSIQELCDIVHRYGGLVYMDGANMNAQVGLCRPGDMGADVCHLNLHKTFAIPHGGGGPGMGPIAVNKKLAPYLPAHPLATDADGHAAGPVAAAPYGSASILLISWAYIAMMGGAGLTRASEIAILNANYIAKRLESAYDILYRGERGTVAHEFILDLRPFRQSADLTEVDVAKRLMDYGYHAPTMSWPVVGTMMVEPTESESRAELDRFCEAMLSIRAEIRDVELGAMDRGNNTLTNAPHTARLVTADDWPFSYSRQRAAFPADWTQEHKFWPSVRRVNDAYGDRNLVCTCPPIEAYAV